MRFKIGDSAVDVVVDIDRFELPITRFLPDEGLDRLNPHYLSLSPTMLIESAAC